MTFSVRPPSSRLPMNGGDHPTRQTPGPMLQDWEGGPHSPASSHPSYQNTELPTEEEQYFYESISTADFLRSTGARLRARFLLYFTFLSLLPLTIALILPPTLRVPQIYALIIISSGIFVNLVGIIVLNRFVRPIREASRRLVETTEGVKPSIFTLDRLSGDVGISIQLLDGISKAQERQSRAIFQELYHQVEQINQLDKHIKLLVPHLRPLSTNPLVRQELIEIINANHQSYHHATAMNSLLSNAFAEKRLSSLRESNQEIQHQLSSGFKQLQQMMREVEVNLALSQAPLQ